MKEQIKDPEQCLECLKAVMLQEDTIDLFTSTYEDLFKTFKDDHGVLRQMAEILGEQTAFVYSVLVDRKEAGMTQGGRN
jgi:hypothetical protein